MANLRAGLIGLGMMGRHHARVLRELPGIDVAVCAVPTAMHEPIGLALAEAGVHTLVEKPVAHSVVAGERLVEAFARRGLVGAVGHIERYNPALQALRTRVADGQVGEVFQIATRRQGPFPARIADVGVVKDLATHDIDLTSWLAQSRYVAVTAQTTTRSGRPHEDMVAVTGRLENGTITNHLVNWLSPMKERVTIVTGSKGAFVADTLTADLTFHGNGVIDTEWDSVANFRGVSEGDVTRFAIPKPEPLRVEHEAFRDAVLGLRDHTVSLADGLETLRTAEWVLGSAERTAADLPV